MHLLSVHLSFDGFAFCSRYIFVEFFFSHWQRNWITTNRRLNYNVASAILWLWLGVILKLSSRCCISPYWTFYYIKTMEILLQNCNFSFVFVSVLWFFYTLFNCKIADFYFSTEYPTNTSRPFVYSLWILILENEMIRTKLHLKSTLVLYSNEAMRSRFYEVFLCFEFTAVFSTPCHNFKIRDCFLYTEL